jgi:FtsP/CotA-like multicopper oxidase with cupredoxin domain
LQTGTPYYDGTSTVSQCPIAPGKTFTYRFRAELFGFSWWHSHLSSQYVSGTSGPIVVYGPTEDEADIDIGPVMLSDWFHKYYFNLIEQVYIANPSCNPTCPPQADNMVSKPGPSI